MTVVIALNREPITWPLRPPFAGCTVTLRRLTSNEFTEARNAATALLRDKAALFELLEHWDLRPAGRRIGDLVADVQFMAGIGEWLAAVECGVRAISAWSGFMDSQGPDARPLPVTREVLQAAFLNDILLQQVMPLIDRAANLTASEGNVSGVSPNGSPAQGRTASAPNTAPVAPAPKSPAPRVARGRGRASSAPRLNTPPSP